MLLSSRKFWRIPVCHFFRSLGQQWVPSRSSRVRLRFIQMTTWQEWADTAVPGFLSKPFGNHRWNTHFHQLFSSSTFHPERLLRCRELQTSWWCYALDALFHMFNMVRSDAQHKHKGWQNSSLFKLLESVISYLASSLVNAELQIKSTTSLKQISSLLFLKAWGKNSVCYSSQN